jgi:hypothetical protein
MLKYNDHELNIMIIKILQNKYVNIINILNIVY